jgi:hypothetical protein
MPDWLTTALSNPEEIPLSVLAVRLVTSFVAGILVALVYAATHKRDESYHPSFVTTLVLLSILIAVVTQVVGQNVARAFSLVGALAIVRFRTVVADTRDTAFVIYAVVVGMAIGAGQFAVAAVGLVVAAAAAFALMPRTRFRAAARWRLTVRIGIEQAQAAVEPVLARHFSSHELVGSSTARQGAALELSYVGLLGGSASPAALVADLNGTNGVQQADLVRV